MKKLQRLGKKVKNTFQQIMNPKPNMEEARGYNFNFAIWWVQCFYDRLVQGVTF